MQTISFVIPVYRNAGTLAATYTQIKTLFQTELSQYRYEIIFIDDGSDDNSLNEILALRDQDTGIKALSFTRNFGQVAAMSAGFKKAKGDVVINISADLQDPILLIPKMLEHWKTGSELVICHRTERQDHLSARFFSRIAHRILRLSIPALPSGGFDFVLMDKKVVQAYLGSEIRNRFFQGDLLSLGYRTSFIPYARLKRKIGQSQYSFWKKLKYFTDACLDASYLPIRAISGLGIFISLLGLGYAGTVTISHLLDSSNPVSGYTPLMIALLIIGGIILTMLGIIGEYIWRIYDQIRNKPLYLIRDDYS